MDANIMSNVMCAVQVMSYFLLFSLILIFEFTLGSGFVDQIENHHHTCTSTMMHDQKCSGLFLMSLPQLLKQQ